MIRVSARVKVEEGIEVIPRTFVRLCTPSRGLFWLTLPSSVFGRSFRPSSIIQALYSSHIELFFFSLGKSSFRPRDIPTSPWSSSRSRWSLSCWPPSSCRPPSPRSHSRNSSTAVSHSDIRWFEKVITLYLSPYVTVPRLFLQPKRVIFIKPAWEKSPVDDSNLYPLGHWFFLPVVSPLALFSCG